MLIVRRADHAHRALVAQAPQQRKPVVGPDEVVHLIDVHAAAVPARALVRLPLRLVVVGGPQLVGDERIVAPAPIVSESTRSAAPYIGDVSNSVAPAA